MNLCYKNILELLVLLTYKILKVHNYYYILTYSQLACTNCTENSNL